MAETDDVSRRTILQASGAFAGFGMFSTKTVAANQQTTVHLVESMIRYEGDDLIDQQPVFNCGFKDYQRNPLEDSIVLRDNISKNVKRTIKDNNVVVNGWDYRAIPGVIFGDNDQMTLPIKTGPNLSEEQSIQTAGSIRHPSVVARVNGGLTIEAGREEYDFNHEGRNSLTIELDETMMKVFGDEPGQPRTVSVTPYVELQSYGEVDVYWGGEP